MTHTRQGHDMSPSSINRWINAIDPINLKLPARAARQNRVRIVALACVVIVIVGATMLMIVRMG